MESWEYTYQYIMRDDKVLVAPIFLECMECDFTTWRSRDMITHQSEHGHFYRLEPAMDRLEEWSPNRHPGLPMMIRRRLSEAFKASVFKTS